jgi:hypothetical protein
LAGVAFDLAGAAFDFAGAAVLAGVPFAVLDRAAAGGFFVNSFDALAAFFGFVAGFAFSPAFFAVEVDAFMAASLP